MTVQGTTLTGSEYMLQNALNSNNAENVGLGFKPKGGDENSRFKLNGAQNITWSQSQIADPNARRLSGQSNLYVYL